MYTIGWIAKRPVHALTSVLEFIGKPKAVFVISHLAQAPGCSRAICPDGRRCQCLAPVVITIGKRRNKATRTREADIKRPILTAQTRIVPVQPPRQPPAAHRP